MSASQSPNTQRLDSDEKTTSQSDPRSSSPPTQVSSVSQPDWTPFEQQLLDLQRDVYLHSESDAAEIPDMLDSLSRIREATRTLKMLDDHLLERVRKLGASDRYEIPGAVAEIKWGKERRAWKHDELASVVSERILMDSIDPETGAVDVPISQLITAILDYAHVDYWKKTNLKQVGVDVDEYCETKPAKMNVQFHRAR